MLIYPTIKMSPLLGLQGSGGGLGYLAPKGGAGGGLVDTSAAHFYDFSSSYNDQVGSIDFSSATGSMALGSSSGSYGQPPGWSGGYGYMSSATSSNSNFMRTSTLPDMSGDFCIDCCSYNPHAVNSNANQVWSLGNSSNSMWAVSYTHLRAHET